MSAEEQKKLLRTLAEIHNRLGELVMVMQVLAMSQTKEADINPNQLEEILEKSRTISIDDEHMRSSSLNLGEKSKYYEDIETGR